MIKVGDVLTKVSGVGIKGFPPEGLRDMVRTMLPATACGVLPATACGIVVLTVCNVGIVTDNENDSRSWEHPEP